MLRIASYRIASMVANRRPCCSRLGDKLGVRTLECIAYAICWILSGRELAAEGDSRDRHRASADGRSYDLSGLLHISWRKAPACGESRAATTVCSPASVASVSTGTAETGTVAQRSVAVTDYREGFSFVLWL